jgi:hypothetical protein
VGEVSQPIRGMEKEELLWRRVAPNWGFVICGKEDNNRGSLEQNGAK